MPDANVVFLDRRIAAGAADEVLRAAEKAEAVVQEGRSNVPGMTYEEGVAYALRWALGHDDAEPMEE